MENAVAARSAAATAGRPSGRRGAPAGLRTGTALRERTRGAAATTSSPVRVGSMSATAVRIEEDGRPAARSVAVVAPAADRWADRPAFFFDLACPYSYLAAERIERMLGDVEWVPVPSLGADEPEAVIKRASALAHASRLPLVLPEAFPASVPRAMRAAAHAAEIGAGARFAMAALRLGFCGGFDLEKPSVLTDVAAASGISATDCLAAAGEEWRDADLRETAALLSAQGVTQLPVIGVDGRWFDGLSGLTDAAAWMRRD